MNFKIINYIVQNNFKYLKFGILQNNSTKNNFFPISISKNTFKIHKDNGNYNKSNKNIISLQTL